MSKYGIASNNTEERSLTFQELQETVRQIEENRMQDIKSPFIPEGTRIMKGGSKIVIIKEDNGKVIVIDDPIFKSF
jgi:hypothetical protein